MEDVSGVPVVEAYGMTETSGIITVQSKGKTKIGSVGVPIPGTELKILDDGEICCRGEQNINGYFKNEEATNELLKSISSFVYSFDSTSNMKMSAPA